MVRRASARATSVVALSVATVAATMFVASTASTSLLGTPHHPADELPKGPVTKVHHRPPPNPPAIPEWLSTTLLILLMVAVVALVWFAKRSRRSSPERLQFEEDEERSGTGDWEAWVITELGDAASDERRRLLHGDPRNAIVACWMHLQDATARAGLPPHSAETSTEFTGRVLRRLRLDEEAIMTLSGLYREARFSDHRMAEPERARAIAAVGVLADDIDTRHRRPENQTPRRQTVDSVST